MNLHKHARLSPRGRALLVDRILVQGLRVEEAAHAAGVSVRTAYKWLKRYREEGRDGLTDLEPAAPQNRYEYAQPGQLLHLDIKKLGRIGSPGHRITGERSHRHRGIGWEYVHLAIDDHSRVAFGCIEPDERGSSACKALIRAVRYYRTLGVCFQRVLTDNGACYTSRRFRRLLRRLGMRHLRTRPYTPRTNGKAERLVQTTLREWAYARSYANSEQRADAFNGWLHHYNWHRPHASLGHQPPISRIPLNNVLGLHS